MDFENHQEVIIIGGGIAGLCAAIELCRHGLTPVVIEAGTYPAHKVCGEFLSPESLGWLKQLDINPIPIANVQFDIGTKKVDYTFPTPAGGLSHCILDPALVEHARRMGTKILTQVKVVSFHPKQNHSEKHTLELSTGETLSASSIIIAAGRLGSLSSPSTQFKYMGIKAHFEGLELGNSLKMFGFSGAYLGLSPIEDGKTNLACLATTHRVEQAGSVDQLMIDLIAKNSHLQELLKPGRKLFDQWMSAPIPFFGFKNTPSWQDAYFIGDAALSIPPACGEGLSLAITSGFMAARYTMAKDFLGYKNDFHSLCSSPLRVAKGLHYLLMHPVLGKLAIQGCTLCPALKHVLFKASRHSHLLL